MVGPLPLLPLRRGLLPPGELRVIAALAGLVAAALLIVGGFVYASSVRQDALQVESEERAMAVSVRALLRGLAQNARHYAWWDDVLRRLAPAPDPVWAERTIGPDVTRAFGYEVSFAIDDDGRTVYGRIDGQEGRGDAAAVLGPRLGELVARARAVPDTEPLGVSAVLTNDREAFAAAASRVAPATESGLRPPSGPATVLLLAKRLDAAWLRGLEADQGVRDLRLTGPGPPDPALATLALDGPDGGAAQRLVWQPFRAGQDQRGWLVPMVLGSLLVLTALATLAIRSVRRSTASIRRSEVLLHSVVESLPFELWVCDRDHRCVLQNAASRARLGDRLGRVPEEASCPSAAAVAWRALAGETVRVEGVQDIEGGKRPVERVLAPLRSQGSILGYVGLTVDVTGRRQAEAALEESEERLRLAVEATGIGTWDVDPVARRHRWSEEFRAILGLPDGTRPDPALFASLIHPEDRDWVNERYRRAYELADEGRYAAEFRIHRADDGSERWVSATGRVFADAAGRAVRAVGTLMDITAQKQVEAALRESEERYRTLVETSPDAVHLHQDGVIILANRQAAALLGAASPEELVGRPAFSICDPADLPMARERTARLNAPGTRNDLAEFTFRRLDGSPIAVEAASAGVLVNGRLAVLVAFRDITARKAAEQQQRLLLRELSHRVKNTLAVVQSIAAQSLSDERSPAEARAVLAERLKALANTHTLLTASSWQGASLSRLVAAELAPYGSRATVTGAEVVLGSKMALTLGLVLHELATNAAKYGALSVPEGRVEVAWALADGVLRLTWREAGGPAVTPPTRHGFGRLLVERIVAHDLGGRARIEFRPEGVVYELTASVEEPAGPR